MYFFSCFRGPWQLSIGHWPRTTTKTTLRWISRAGHLGSIAKVEIHGWWSRCPSWTSTHFLRTYGRIAWGALDELDFIVWKFPWISSDGLSCRWRFDLVYSVESKKILLCKSWGFLGFDEVQDLLVLKAESMLFLWDIFSQQNLGKSLFPWFFVEKSLGLWMIRKKS